MYNRRENTYYLIIGFLGTGVFILANILLDSNMRDEFVIFLILILLGLIIEKYGLKVGDLVISLDTSVMLACYFIMGLVPVLWLNLILVGLHGLFFESIPKRKIFNNTGMFVLIYVIAHFIFMAMKYAVLGSMLDSIYIDVVVFGLIVFAINWGFLTFQLKTIFGNLPKGFRESFKWDFYSNIVVIPLSILLITSYKSYSYFGITLISFLVFAAILFFKLFRNLVFMNNELRVVHEVSASINSKLDLNETTASILKGIQELVGCDFSILLEYDMNVKKMNIIDSRVINEMLVDLIKIENIINLHLDDLISLKKGFVIENVKRNKQIKSISDLSDNVSSLIYQPLIQENKIVGCILICSDKPNKFSHEQLKILDVLANQVIIAMGNAKQYRSIQNKAIHDSLTGLFNQRHFYDSLDMINIKCEDCNKNKGTQCFIISLILFDIDHFKFVNDNYGHQTGDKILKEIAEIMKDSVRNSDIVFRYGGEEFVILLPNTDEKQAHSIADRIRKTVERYVFVGLKGERIKLTISGGISSSLGEATSGSILLSHADRAMYVGAKQKGRNKVCIYNN